MCSEWKKRAILDLDLSADSALLKLRKIHHFQISGGMYIKQLTNQEQELPTSSTLNTQTTYLLEEEEGIGDFQAESDCNPSPPSRPPSQKVASSLLDLESAYVTDVS